MAACVPCVARERKGGINMDKQDVKVILSACVCIISLTVLSDISSKLNLIESTALFIMCVGFFSFGYFVNEKPINKKEL